MIDSSEDSESKSIDYNEDGRLDTADEGISLV